VSDNRAHRALTGITRGLTGRRRISAPPVSAPGSSPQGAYSRAPRPWAILGLLLLCAAPAAAQVKIALTFEVVPGGAPMTGSSTNTAGLTLGTVSATGPIGSFLTRTTTPAAFTVSTPFGVRVTKRGPTSRHTLQARLLAPPTFQWRVNGTVMSTAFATVGTGLDYGAVRPLNLALTVPTTAPPGAVSAAIEVLAIAN